jgi:hypothetical protein
MLAWCLAAAAALAIAAVKSGWAEALRGTAVQRGARLMGLRRGDRGGGLGRSYVVLVHELG